MWFGVLGCDDDIGVIGYSELMLMLYFLNFSFIFRVSMFMLYLVMV